MEGGGYESIRACHGLSVTEKKKTKHQVIPTINILPGVQEELTLGRATFASDALTHVSAIWPSLSDSRNLELETQVSE